MKEAIDTQMKLIKITSKEEADKYDLLPFNRKAKVRNDLIESMNKYGFVLPILVFVSDLITGKKTFFVGDGQNRLITALYLNIPIYVVQIKTYFKTLDEMVAFISSLNTAQKPWYIQDYVNAYAFLNYSEYVTLNRLASKTPYTIATIAYMLYGFRSSRISGHVSTKIKKGQFKCNLLEETQETLKFAARLSKIGRLTSRMILALHYVMHTSKKFNKDKFEEIYKYKYALVKELKLDDYSDIFSEWVNNF